MVDRHQDYAGDVYAKAHDKAVNPGASIHGADRDQGIAEANSFAEQTAGDYSRAQGQQLKGQQGDAIRGDAPAPSSDYLAHTHQDLYNMVHVELDASDVDASGHVANKTADWLAEVNNRAVAASKSEQAAWQGPSADKAHGIVTSNADWADSASNGIRLNSNRYSQQAAAASNAKNSMPPPSNFNQAAEMDKARQQVNSGDLAGFVNTQAGITTQQAAAQQGHEQAAQVLHTMDTTYHDTASTQPSFAPPPDLSGNTASEQTHASGFTSTPSGTSGNMPTGGGGPVPGTPGTGGTGSGYVPPTGPGAPGASTGAGQFPGQYGSNPPGGAGGTSVPRPGPPGTPIAGPIGGPVGRGGGSDITRGLSGRGGGPRTNFAGSRVSGGGLTPKEGSAGSRLAEEGKTGGKGPGAGAKEGPIGRGGPAASGKAGAGGASGLGRGGKGKKEDDEEHKRKYGEAEDHFDVKLTEGPDGEKIVPPVIGDK